MMLLRESKDKSGWKKIFINRISDRELVAKIRRTLKIQQLNKKQLRMEKYLNRHPTKGDIQMANTHVKRCPTLFVTQELQIKTRYYLLQT